MSLSGSDLSSLSSAPPSEDESPTMDVDKPVGITKYFKKESPQSPPAKREPSPPHEYVLADNPHIAFIVMFRARFQDAFPRSTPHFGPQDIEKGAEEKPAGDHIERLLCAFLGMVLNRKKEVERNHYTRPLEEAISTHAPQWPKEWQGRNPLRGGNTFSVMSPDERILLLKSLALWSLGSSEAVQAKIKESYKQSRHEDDLNQPLSVQPWGKDGLKRRYWLIEGMDDTHFRLYRESNPALKKVTWWSIAGSIPELRAVAEKLGEERSTNSKKLRDRISNAIPRFEASEDKRKRRDYRIARKAAFARPEPGFSLYEGRTRGKKLKYTFDDDEEVFSDELPSTRRSTRNASGVSTPAEPAAPRFSASGRQIRTRAGALYGATLLAGGQGDGADEDSGRPRRTRTSTRANGYADLGMMDEDIGVASEAENSSGNEWQGDDEEEENEIEVDEGDGGDGESDEDSIMEDENPSLVVQLKYGKVKAPDAPQTETPAEKPVLEAQGTEPVSGPKDIPPFQPQLPLVNGPSDTTQDSPMVDAKAAQVPHPDNADVEKQEPALQGGPNGVM